MSDHTAHSTPARDDSPLALLLDPLPHDDPADADLSALLLALVSPASPDDLVGRDVALATFAARAAGHGPPRPAIRRAGAPRGGTVRRLVTVPAVAVATGGVVLAGGLSAAAYTGSLPDALQEIASRVIGAPPPAPDDPVPDRPALGPTPTASPSPTPTASPSPEPPGVPGPATTPVPGPSVAPPDPAARPPDDPGAAEGDPGGTGGPAPAPSVPPAPRPTVALPSLPLPTVSVPSLPLPTVSVPPVPLPSVPTIP